MATELGAEMCISFCFLIVLLTGISEFGNLGAELTVNAILQHLDCKCLMGSAHPKLNRDGRIWCLTCYGTLRSSRYCDLKLEIYTLEGKKIPVLS